MFPGRVEFGVYGLVTCTVTLMSPPEYVVLFFGLKIVILAGIVPGIGSINSQKKLYGFASATLTTCIPATKEIKIAKMAVRANAVFFKFSPFSFD
jgi:hypothetical protein